MIASPFARPAMLLLPILLGLQITSSSETSTPSGDPLFGEGCRVVYVETSTALRPEVEVCRPL